MSLPAISTYYLQCHTTDRATGVAAPQYFSSGHDPFPARDGALWKAALTDAITVHVDIPPFDKAIGGAALPGWGTIEIGLDRGTSNLDVLAALSWEGRLLELYEITPDTGIELRGRFTAEEVTWTGTTFTIALRDYATYMDVPLQEHTYAGTGGVEGSVEMTGLPVPLLLGWVDYIEPVIVDAAARIYQLHDGTVNVQAVHDRGAGLALDDDGEMTDLYAWESDEFDGGKYRKDSARGLIRLGAVPVGPVTCSALQMDCLDPVTGFPSQHPADVFRYVAERNGMGFGTLDELAIATLKTAAPAFVEGDLYVRETTTKAAVMDRIAQSLGALWTFTRNGQLRIRQIGFSEPSLTLTERTIVDVPRRERTEAPVWRCRVTHAATRQFSEQELVPGVTGLARARLMRGYNTARVFEVPALRTLAPRARDLEMALALHNDNHSSTLEADTESARQAALLAHDRDRYTLQVRGRKWNWDIGLTIHVTYPRFGLDGDYLITGITESTRADEPTELRVWGPA